MSTRDFLISAALISAGIATMAVIISPTVDPHQWPTNGQGRIVADRWPEATPKIADLQVTLLEPSLLDPALIGPSEGDPVPASITVPDQKIILNSARPREPSETCSRHGMRRQYFYRHHHLIWRCRRR